MELTGKCKEDFEKYMIPELRKMDGVGSRFFDETIIKQFEILPECFKKSMIIKFFNQVKFEGKSLFLLSFDLYYKQKIEHQSFESICNNAIESCNTFYNDMVNEINQKLHQKIN